MFKCRCVLQYRAAIIYFLEGPRPGKSTIENNQLRNPLQIACSACEISESTGIATDAGAMELFRGLNL